MFLPTLSTAELAELLKSENSRFSEAFNANQPFDYLKTIRVNIRIIEDEIKKRQEHA